MSWNTPALNPVPLMLASWLRESGFDRAGGCEGCAWHPAQPTTTRTTRKLVGTDAWRYGDLVLSRVPVGTDDLRYYACVCPATVMAPARAPAPPVGYWLEVRRRPPYSLSTRQRR